VEEAFNPYSEWLGIQGGRRPANHYELLGIKPYETDAAVIAQAADKLTARIRGIRPGPRVAEWQRLLDTVTGAKRCLLDPTAKAAYDAALRGQTSPPQPAGPSSQGWTAPTMAVPSPPTTAARPAWQPAVQPPSRPPAPSAPPAPSTAIPLAVGTTSPGDQPGAFPRGGSPGGFAMARARARRSAPGLSAAQMAVGVVTVALIGSISGSRRWQPTRRNSGKPIRRPPLRSLTAEEPKHPDHQNRATTTRIRIRGTTGVGRGRRTGSSAQAG